MCVATGTYSFEELAASEPDYLLEDFSDTEEVMRILYQF
jgi:hypothetical protein